MLFKAVVFRPDGHSDFMTGPEGYSTSVLAGDDWPGRLPYLPSPGLLAVFFTGAFEAAAFFPRRPALRQVAVSEVGSLKKEIASSLSA